MSIKVNMKELAEKIADECPMLIKENTIELLNNDLDETIIADYICNRTAIGYIITELDYELLRSELVVFIQQELFKRIKKQIKNIDKEDLKIFEKVNREYEVEKDGY